MIGVWGPRPQPPEATFFLAWPGPLVILLGYRREFDFYAAVFAAAGVGVVGGDGELFAVAAGGDAGAVYALVV